MLADYHSPGFAFDRWFELDLGRLQYLGFYLPAAAIARATGPDAAVRIMLSLIAVATSAAFWMLLGAFGRDRRLAVFAPAVFHTTPLYLGFFNFIESIPLALALLALTERELRGPAVRRAAVMGLGGAALLWLHPSALAFTLGASAVLALTSAEPRRRMARALAPYLPALLLLGAWTLQALASRGGPGAPALVALRSRSAPLSGDRGRERLRRRPAEDLVHPEVPSGGDGDGHGVRDVRVDPEDADLHFEQTDAENEPCGADPVELREPAQPRHPVALFFRQVAERPQIVPDRLL